MMTTLMKSIQTEIDAVVFVFCERLAEKHGICKDEIMELWKEASESKVPVSIKKKATHKTRKESGYNIFVKTTNPIIRKEHPDWKFGEMSKETARRWKALSSEEKERYGSSTTSLKEDTPQKPHEEDSHQDDVIPPPTQGDVPMIQKPEEEIHTTEPVVVIEKLPKRPRVIKRKATIMTTT